MARAALLHLLKSKSKAFNSGNHLSRVVPWADTLCSKTNANSPVQFPSVQRRFISRSAPVADKNKISIGNENRGEEGIDEKDYGFVYNGPLSNTIKKVKLLSLSTCCLSVSLGPIVTFMTSQDTNVILKGAVASSVIFLSASTTGALHWFVSPYVHKLRWQPGSDSFEVDMMSWLGTYITKTIMFADIRPPDTNRPYVSFKANGNFYYVDEERCDNKALLAKLNPHDRSRDTAFKNL
ncbi:uncharacterized protein LOC131001962 isoform X2 [Salvia miltiorrhiza]|uniref:uncharacterized protein LOC131001962 isoform X2 n=1 Tax=Salvia miltiorrhiza TaxID=226208 RepID=UPI0025AC69FC|nr:uncharacterized protein LOC131001962 isoform X2 [Salvia miltiorrhiza]